MRIEVIVKTWVSVKIRANTVEIIDTLDTELFEFQDMRDSVNKYELRYDPPMLSFEADINDLASIRETIALDYCPHELYIDDVLEGK